MTDPVQAPNPPFSSHEADFSSGRLTLHRRSVIPTSMPWAKIAILHGYGDHAGRYVHFMYWLAERGIASHIFDFRGHGLSTGRRAFVRRWEEFLEDTQAFLALDALRNSPGPTILLGHSHGGLIAAIAVERGLVNVDACILSAPFFEFELKIPLHKLILGHIADWIVPSLRIHSGLSAEMMSSDPQMQSPGGQPDPLLNPFATPRWFTTLQPIKRELLDRAPQFRLPLLCLTGAADPVADNTVTADFLARIASPDKTHIPLPNQLHEILRERNREITFTLILDWLGNRFPRPTPAQSIS